MLKYLFLETFYLISIAFLENLRLRNKPAEYDILTINTFLV